MECKHIQTTVALRKQNGIKSYRILDIQDEYLIFQLWLNSDEQGKVMVSAPEKYKIGQYIDLQVIRTSKTSHTVKLIGQTPQKFIPASKQNIAVF